MSPMCENNRSRLMRGIKRTQSDDNRRANAHAFSAYSSRPQTGSHEPDSFTSTMLAAAIYAGTPNYTLLS